MVLINIYGGLDLIKTNKNEHLVICRDQDSNLGYCGHNAGS